MLTRGEILAWLRERDEARLQELWRRADAVRRERVGDEVHLRGLVEISNHCARACAYCGIRAGRSGLPRYRMGPEEILGCAAAAARLGFGTLVLQSGEDPALTAAWVADLVRAVKAATPLAVTLSLGERDETDLALWRAAGADRYLLRFETSDRSLFDRIHPAPPGRRSDRLAQLRTLAALGYEVGSGVMVGIPGQSLASLADDILLFRDLDLDMIGVGPYLAHPETPLGRPAGGGAPAFPDAGGDQAPSDELTACKVVALARLACPRANIPSTTALATINRADGREHGLLRGANVVMPNLTPPAYRARDEIYPDKACRDEDVETCAERLRCRLAAIGRRAGSGRGDARAPERLRAGPGAERCRCP